MKGPLLPDSAHFRHKKFIDVQYMKNFNPVQLCHHQSTRQIATQSACEVTMYMHVCIICEGEAEVSSSIFLSYTMLYVYSTVSGRQCTTHRQKAVQWQTSHTFSTSAYVVRYRQGTSAPMRTFVTPTAWTLSTTWVHSIPASITTRIE